MSFEYRIEDNIVIFLLKNGKTNAITLETLEGLRHIIDRLNNETDLKGMVISGTGKYFSSGFDLDTFTSFANNQAIIDWFKVEEEALYQLFTCSKPVVAAVNGTATAAGMIVSMACDYRMIVNNPKIKLGMTEIKLGLALSPAEVEIMRFGLDTDKKFRDVIFSGTLFDPSYAVQQGIFDELIDDESELINQAKAKVSAFIDHPGRSFIGLKYMEKKHSAATIRAEIEAFDWNILVDLFTNQEVLGVLRMVKQALGA